MALAGLMWKHAEAIRMGCMHEHAVFMSGHCTRRPAVSTPALSLGCDMLAAAQQRHSFSVLLSSVIKGRGKSRGKGWALIAFHGREERAAACPGGLRRC